MAGEGGGVWQGREGGGMRREGRVCGRGPVEKGADFRGICC